MVPVLRHRHEPALPLLGHEQRLRARVEHAVSALELGAVDGEVGLVDQLVRVRSVAREAGDADRDRRPDRLARGLDVECAGGDRAPDPLGDLEGLLRRRLGKQDRELLAAEARRHVVVAQLRAEDLGDALQDGVAGEVAVGVVDVAQEVEVGHHQRQRPLEALRARELLVQGDGEVAGVEEPGLRVDARLLLQLRHAKASGGSADSGATANGISHGFEAQKAAIRRRASRARGRSRGSGTRRAPTRGSSGRAQGAASAPSARG